MIKLAIGGLIFMAVISAAVLLWICCAIAGVAEDREHKERGK